MKLERMREAGERGWEDTHGKVVKLGGELRSVLVTQPTLARLTASAISAIERVLNPTAKEGRSSQLPALKDGQGVPRRGKTYWQFQRRRTSS